MLSEKVHLYVAVRMVTTLFVSVNTFMDEVFVITIVLHVIPFKVGRSEPRHTVCGLMNAVNACGEDQLLLALGNHNVHEIVLSCNITMTKNWPGHGVGLLRSLTIRPAPELEARWGWVPPCIPVRLTFLDTQLLPMRRASPCTHSCDTPHPRPLPMRAACCSLYTGTWEGWGSQPWSVQMPPASCQCRGRDVWWW